MHCHCHAGSQPLAGQRVIEVGAGVGIVGLTAAALGAQVVLTDLAAVLPGLRQNIQVQ
jgi:protein N-lysine methyltransferase METTL21D